MVGCTSTTTDVCFSFLSMTLTLAMVTTLFLFLLCFPFVNGLFTPHDTETWLSSSLSLFDDFCLRPL